MKRKEQALLISTAVLFLLLQTVPGKPSSRGPVWHTFEKGVALAKAREKPLLIDFYADWCHWCRLMEKRTFRDPKVIDYLRRHFITVRVHTDRRRYISYKGRKFSPAQLLAYMGGRGLPTVVFADRKGNLITKIPGFIEKAVFLPLLTYIKKECYRKTVPFDKKFIRGESVCR